MWFFKNTKQNCSLNINYTEVVSWKEYSQWIFAMNKKIESLYNNQNIIECKLVYKRKDRILRVEDERCKTCLVAKGFTQRKGVDFNKVFSLIMKDSSIQVLLIMIALFDLKLEQLDVKIIFLYDELEKSIYIHQLKGFITQVK